MNIPINVKATVRCNDGKCYPCLVLSIVTPDTTILSMDDYLPKYGIRFTGDRPVSILMTKVVVNMNSVFFGGE